MAHTTRRSSNETKAALSRYVLPETMDDIEEFLKPQFPPKIDQQRAVKQQDKEDEDDDFVEGRRIVMDGFGRWREVRPKKFNPPRKLELVNSKNLSSMKQVFGMESAGSPRSSRLNTPLEKSRYDKFKSHGEHFDSEKIPQSRRCSDATSVYSNIGMITRSNVFPGIGNYQWNSTTARTFTEKPITPVEDRKVFFGLQTDDFGAWSAANVLNERMKKAWGEYVESLPKAKATDQTVQQIVHAKPKQPPPPKQPKTTTKPKKNSPKTKTKQDNIVNDDHPFQEPENLPNEPQPPPPYVPEGDDADDDFWDFYDKPFNKPER